MKKLLSFLSAAFLLLALASPAAFAHSGRTDSNGGHTNHSTGEYHYHHGNSAHQHEDLDGDGVLDCPFDFVNNTDHLSGNSVVSSRSHYDDIYTPVPTFDPVPTIKPEPVRAKLKISFDDFIQLFSAFVMLCFIASVCGAFAMNAKAKEKTHSSPPPPQPSSPQPTPQETPYILITHRDRDCDYCPSKPQPVRPATPAPSKPTRPPQPQYTVVPAPKSTSQAVALLPVKSPSAKLPQIPTPKPRPLNPRLAHNSRYLAARNENMQVYAKSGDTYKIVVASGNKYSVTLRSCTCPDFLYRRNICKHMYRLMIEMKIIE